MTGHLLVCFEDKTTEELRNANEYLDCVFDFEVDKNNAEFLHLRGQAVVALLATYSAWRLQFDPLNKKTEAREMLAQIKAAEEAHHGEDGLVEILAVVSFYGFLNRWNDSLATELEEIAFDKASKTLAETNWDAGKHRPKER